jgi:N-acyl-D-amino-acid deacylase
LEKPAQYPHGIEYVLVNGKMVIEKGNRTANNPGRVIRRTG